MTELLIQQNKPWTVVRFSASALTDSHHIEEVNREMEQSIAKLPYRGMLLINFRGVEFVSSQVLGMLLNAKAKMGEKSGTLVLCRLSPKLREALEITGLVRQFTIEESETAVVGEKTKRQRTSKAHEVGWVH